MKSSNLSNSVLFGAIIGLGKVRGADGAQALLICDAEDWVPGDGESAWTGRVPLLDVGPAAMLWFICSCFTLRWTRCVELRLFGFMVWFIFGFIVWFMLGFILWLTSIVSFIRLFITGVLPLFVNMLLFAGLAGAGGVIWTSAAVENLSKISRAFL